MLLLEMGFHFIFPQESLATCDAHVRKFFVGPTMFSQCPAKQELFIANITGIFLFDADAMGLQMAVEMRPLSKRFRTLRTMVVPLLRVNERVMCERKFVPADERAFNN